ncbi:MAG: hypothetical protein AB8B50_03945 [Pirellulaceae bacterium]
MDKKAKAALKMAMGAGQVVSGAMTASGKGILGGMCKSQGMMGQAARCGTMSIKQGSKKFQEGLEDFKKS